MFQIIKFLTGYCFCLIIFSLTTSLLVNLMAYNRISLGGHFSALYILIMFSPTILGYYVIHYYVQFKKQDWNSQPKYIMAFMLIAISYTYIFGFLFPIIGLISKSPLVVYQFLGMSVSSGATYLVFRDSISK